MGFPRIFYNGKTIDFDIDVETMPIDAARDTAGSISVSGIEETLNVRSNTLIRVAIPGFVQGKAADETLRLKIEQWWQWALSGNTWTFARDSTKAASTTLTGVELAGETTIGVASSTGLAVGDLCVIRSATHQELVKILTVDSATQVTLTETLNVQFASGSRFRHEEYWPGRLVNKRNPIQKDSRMTWKFDLEFREDVNTL